MTPADRALIVKGLDIFLTLAANGGMAVTKILALREANASGHLTDEQVTDLAYEARDAVNSLGPRKT